MRRPSDTKHALSAKEAWIASLQGAASVFDVGGAQPDDERLRSDLELIASDWQAVGDDLLESLATLQPNEQ